MKILDTNMILRFLIKDNVEMSDYVKNLIAHNQVSVTNEVIAEVVYVLEKVYKLEKTKAVCSIFTFLKIENVVPKEADVLNTALQAHNDNNLDFVDCVLYAYHKELEYEVCTFDKKLLKLIENK